MPANARRLRVAAIVLAVLAGCAIWGLAGRTLTSAIASRVPEQTMQQRNFAGGYTAALKESAADAPSPIIYVVVFNVLAIASLSCYLVRRRIEDRAREEIPFAEPVDCR